MLPMHRRQVSRILKPDIHRGIAFFQLRRSHDPAPIRPQMSKEDQHLIAMQANKTVSKSIPGKLFMLNYLSHEQSAASITNRIISVLVVLLGSSFIAVYGTDIRSYSIFSTMFLVAFPAYFAYIHMGYWQAFPLLAAGSIYVLR